MDYVRLGSTGMKVSRLCFGCMTYGTKRWRDWVLEEEEGRPFLQKAFESGINFFDTADVYSIGVSEEILGRAVRDFAKRDDTIIATKVFQTMSRRPNDRGLSRKHIMASIDASAPITSISTSFIASIPTPRSRRRSSRSTISFVPARRALSALHRWRRGSS